MNIGTHTCVIALLVAAGSLSAQQFGKDVFELDIGGEMLLNKSFPTLMPDLAEEMKEFSVLRDTLPSGAGLVNQRALVGYLNSERDLPASVRLSAIRQLRAGTERIYGESDVFGSSGAALLESLRKNNSLPRPTAESSVADESDRFEMLSRSVGLIVRSDSISDGPFGPTLTAFRYGTNYELIRETPDYDSPSAQNCGTGFLTVGGQVVTAGHCVDDIGVNLSIIFGYTDKLVQEPVGEGNVIWVRLTGPEVFIRKLTLIKKPDRSRYADEGDWALLEMDQDVPDFLRPLELNEESSPPADDQNLFMIGHPCGLPLRVATKGKILTNEDMFFRTNLDAFIGNSGSPVFNGSTWKVEGILIRGGEDFNRVDTGTGKEWFVVSEIPDGDDGEKVGKISFVIAARKSIW